MKRILFRGPVTNCSGYAVHGRQIASWLLKKEKEGLCKVWFQCLPWGQTHDYLDSAAFNGLLGEIFERSNWETEFRSNGKFDSTVQLQLPNEWDISLGNYNVGVTALVETTICNPKWIEAANKMNKVVVPSTFTKSIMTNSGFMFTDVEVVPESFIDEVLLPVDQLPVDKFKFSTSFNFLAVAQLTGHTPESDRKNLFNTIKWFCEVFENNQEVGLVLKTNNGRNTKLDRLFCEQLVGKLLKEVRGDKVFPKVHLVHGLMSDKEMAALYKHPSIKCYVCLSRGEGFNIPALEAAASGLPVIATNWSGHLDFLNKGKFLKVSYNLEKLHPSRLDDPRHPSPIFIEGAEWANPIEIDAKLRLKKFKDNSSMPQQWAKELQQTIQKEFSLQSVHNIYTEKLKEIF